MSARIVLGNLTVDRDRYEIRIGGQRIDVTFVEFEVLHALARNAGKVVPRGRLILGVWNERALGDDRKLTVHVSRLRKKLRDRGSTWQIQTVTKRGYLLSAPADVEASGGAVAAAGGVNATGGT
jgi:DNA-binding response OmpR family regulator